MNDVIIGLFGSTLDKAGNRASRWHRWRPTLSLFQQPDLAPTRLELLIHQQDQRFASILKKDIQQVAPQTKVHFHPFDVNQPWDFEAVYGALYDFATAYPFDSERENYLVHITTGTHVAQICLFLLTETRFFPAKLIQSSPGTGDNKAQGRYQIIDLDLAKYDQLATRYRDRALQGQNLLKSGINTRNKAFNQMISEIETVAIKSTEPMLMTGPTGAGKSHLAKRIYQLKEQRQGMTGRFVEVNCATIRGDGAMSALFGHQKGAYTGAQQSRAGFLKSADNGLLFLDEIGELGADEQAMLLKAIEEKRFTPLGSDQDVASDFQLIAGTNQPLNQLVAHGRFREDLLARIDCWSYRLPGLAARREDIEPNLDYELARFQKQNQVSVHFADDARATYLEFAHLPSSLWTGNFRDLNASITRMATLCNNGRIRISDVVAEIARLNNRWHQSDTDSRRTVLTGLFDADDLRQIDEFDRHQLSHVVSVCRQSTSMAEAGRRLFQASRLNKAKQNDSQRVRQYLTKFGLSWQTVNDPHKI